MSGEVLHIVACDSSPYVVELSVPLDCVEGSASPSIIEHRSIEVNDGGDDKEYVREVLARTRRLQHGPWSNGLGNKQGRAIIVVGEWDEGTNPVEAMLRYAIYCNHADDAPLYIRYPVLDAPRLAKLRMKGKTTSEDMLTCMALSLLTELRTDNPPPDVKGKAFK